MAWTKIAGSGDVTFSNPNALGTSIAFSKLGAYTLRATASSLSTNGTTDLTVEVVPPGTSPSTGAWVQIEGAWVGADIGEAGLAGSFNSPSVSAFNLTGAGDGVGIDAGETYDEGFSLSQGAPRGFRSRGVRDQPDQRGRSDPGGVDGPWRSRGHRCDGLHRHRRPTEAFIGSTGSSAAGTEPSSPIRTWFTRPRSICVSAGVVKRSAGTSRSRARRTGSLSARPPTWNYPTFHVLGCSLPAVIMALRSWPLLNRSP